MKALALQGENLTRNLNLAHSPRRNVIDQMLFKYVTSARQTKFKSQNPSHRAPCTFKTVPGEWNRRRKLNLGVDPRTFIHRE